MKELESKIVYDSVTHSSSKDGSVPKDQALTYQASTSIFGHGWLPIAQFSVYMMVTSI